MKRTVCFVMACILGLTLTASAQTANAQNPGNNNAIYIGTTITTSTNSSSTVSNYPNPCTFDTTIEYILDTPGHVRLSVYDGGGNLLTSLADEYQEAGRHSTVWNVANRESGTYICTLNCGNTLYTCKILVLK